MKLKLLLATGFLIVLGTSGCQTKSSPALNSAAQVDATKNVTASTVDGKITQENDPNARNLIEKMEWDTSGGGSLHYTLSVNPDDKTSYLIQVTQYQFRTRDEKIVLPAESAHLHNRVDALFAGRLQVVETSSSGATGSFSLVSLYNKLGVQTTYNSPQVKNNGAEKLFDELRTFITTQLGERRSKNRTVTASSACSKLVSLQGAWESNDQNGTQNTNTYSTLKKFKTTDGTEQYYGVDDQVVSGCFGSASNSRNTHYIFDRDQCILTQQVNQTLQSFKILSVGRSNGQSAMVIALCNDTDCTDVSSDEQTLIRKSY